jgi:hypothetical protein
MTYETQTETKTEARALGLVALLCYSATLAAMLACCYSLLGLALRAVGRDFVGSLFPAML